MKNLHLFAHMASNKVKVGDRVKKYETVIGTVGTAEGMYYAHLHFSISESLSIKQLEAYVKGWSKADVENSYRDPRGIDFNKMFGRPMDVGKAGYDWLQKIENNGGFHSGVDVNGRGGGNTDYGWEFTSSCDGVVVYNKRTTAKDGWGNIVIVEEDTVDSCVADLKELKKNLTKLEEKIENQKTEIKKLTEIIEQKNIELEDLKVALEKNSGAYKLLKDIQRVFLSIINFK